jgi:16S rRNA G527 N7-methylase RsmG
VNNIVSDKIKEHFSKYDNLTSNQQLEKYNNILEKINTVLNSNNMTDKQKILLNIIKDVITIKKNSLS